MHLNNNRAVQHIWEGGAAAAAGAINLGPDIIFCRLSLSRCVMSRICIPLFHDRHSLTHGSSGHKATSAYVGYSGPASLPAVSAEMLEFSSSPSPSPLLQVRSKPKNKYLVCVVAAFESMRVHAGFFWGERMVDDGGGRSTLMLKRIQRHFLVGLVAGFGGFGLGRNPVQQIRQVRPTDGGISSCFVPPSPSSHPPPHYPPFDSLGYPRKTQLCVLPSAIRAKAFFPLRLHSFSEIITPLLRKRRRILSPYSSVPLRGRDG